MASRTCFLLLSLQLGYLTAFPFYKLNLLMYQDLVVVYYFVL